MKAIILCAGKGTRFQPVSLFLPKHLTPVNGIPLVENTIRLLNNNGIKDIVLVIGYLAEAFSYLEEKYGATLIYNKHFEEARNNASLALAAEILDGSLVIDGDVLFTRDCLSQIQTCRTVLGRGSSFFVSQRTTHGAEWELLPTENLQPEACLRGDGWHIQHIQTVRKNSPQGFGMCGCSWWEGTGAAMLCQELLSNPHDYSWEDAAIRIMQKTPIYALCLEQPFALELDSLKDALDFHILSHEDIAGLCSCNHVPIRLKGLTNSTWKIHSQEGCFKVLRIPGYGTEQFIKREEEPHIVALLDGLEITPSSFFFVDGFKVTDFLEDHRISCHEDMNTAYFSALAGLLGRMHSIDSSQCKDLAPIHIVDQIRLYEGQTGIKALLPYREWLYARAEEFDGEISVLCHRDLLLENIMVLDGSGTGMQLIDFEYAGFAHPFWDYASFILESTITGTTRKEFLKACGITEELIFHRIEHMEILQDYIWGLWGVVNQYNDYANNRLKRAFTRLCALLEIQIVTYRDCISGF